MDIGTRQGGIMGKAIALSVATIVAATIATPLSGIARAEPSRVVVQSGRPAAAVLPKDVPIQPGAPMIDSGSYFEGSLCTMNFVFKDKAKKNAKTYIASATSCAGTVGRRAISPQVGAFGTVVYSDESDGAADQYLVLGEEVSRFALIQIDESKLKYVSRVVRGFGAAPKGYTTRRTTKVGDPLVTHGYPYGAVRGAQAVTRVGVLGDDSSTRYWASIQPNIQDYGSPVIRADGKAVGMSDEVTSFWGTWLPEAPPFSRFPTVEGLLKKLKSAGFNVTL
jgi:hypothetical protein